MTAQDAVNNTATGYTGTVHFTSSDAAAVLPANTTLTSGTGTFSATLKTAGSQTITATDTVTSTITGTSGTVSVTAAAATHFVVSAPASATAGNAFTFTVTAEDAFNNTATGYTGTVHFTSSDSGRGPAGQYHVDQRRRHLQRHAEDGGQPDVTATDTVTSAITGTSGAITVSAAAATHFVVSLAGQRHGGHAVHVTVTAEDAYQQHGHGLHRHGPLHQQRRGGRAAGQLHA